jgi:hypothetical protein
LRRLGTVIGFDGPPQRLDRAPPWRCGNPPPQPRSPHPPLPRGHTATSPHGGLRSAFAVRDRRPAGGSGLSLAIPRWHAARYDPEELDHRMTTTPSPRSERSALLVFPQSVSRRAGLSLADRHICSGVPSCSPPARIRPLRSGPRGLYFTHPNIHADDPNAVWRFRRTVAANSLLRDAKQRATTYDWLLQQRFWLKLEYQQRQSKLERSASGEIQSKRARSSACSRTAIVREPRHIGQIPMSAVATVIGVH